MIFKMPCKRGGNEVIHHPDYIGSFGRAFSIFDDCDKIDCSVSLMEKDKSYKMDKLTNKFLASKRNFFITEIEVLQVH